MTWDLIWWKRKQLVVGIWIESGYPKFKQQGEQCLLYCMCKFQIHQSLETLTAVTKQIVHSHSLAGASFNDGRVLNQYHLTTCFIKLR